VKVLALDTSTSCLSAALVKDRQTVCEINLQVKTGHAGMVLPVIDEVLRRADTPRDGIELIAVGTGPGSFTGLRIGIATAKGLAGSLGCRLVGVPTLDTLAHAAVPSYLPIMPVVDAKKGEIFCCRYDEHGSRFSGYMNLKPDEVVGMVKDETLFMGSGCELYRDLFIKGMGRRYHESAIHLWNPRASVLAAIALDMPPGGRTTDVLPIYARESDAALLLERSGRKTL